MPRHGRMEDARPARPAPPLARAGRPVEVAVQPARTPVCAVIPCYNRPRDAELLLNDLAALAAADPTVDLSVVLVDNASDEPLASLAPPPGLRLEHLRLEDNRGGSGGFNAGLARALSRGVPCDESEFIWLLDSDARVEPGTLRPLVRALEEHDDLVAVGSALADERGTYEAGGFVDRRTGELVQPPLPAAPNGSVITAEYAAACSLLVRRWAVERAGPLADLFVSGDDVEWCVRLARATGGRVGVAPASIARHPRPDRMRTWSRYYAARNAFVPIGTLSLGARVRFRRALREVGRALTQTLVGRDDLAELHVRGLQDAASGILQGPGPALRFEPFHPISELGPALKAALAGLRVRRVTLSESLATDPAAIIQQLRRLALEPVVARPGPRPRRASAPVRALRRLLSGPPADLAVVSSRARPEDWMAGTTIVTIAPDGFVIRRVARLERLRGVAGVLRRGGVAALKLALSGGTAPVADRFTEPRPCAQRGSISIVVLSHRRWAVLRRTLRRLTSGSDAGGSQAAARVCEVIVVDNHSDDGTREGIAGEFGGVRVVALDANVGVQGYNEGIGAATGDYVLVLDDDSWPDTRALERASRVLDRAPDVAAVALHPRHPETNASEWPFAETMGVRDDWPIMGCGNLVRREAWLRVGGYEPAFFLYRNDTDLALKLLGAGLKVHFDPSLVVWHDSPAAARKSRRWFELATRNWVWVCRRHGRGPMKPTAILAGWAWAHTLARWSAPRHWRVLRGMTQGLFRAAPAVPGSVTPDGSALARIIRIRM